MIMKYRIVKRNFDTRGEVRRWNWYYAQRNIFGIWVDLRLHPFIDTFDSYDMDLNTVERWLNVYISNKGSATEEVVKTYD
jgi:hypothetical protein